MNAKLTKAQETEQAFLLSVSHELKTPLTSIRGYAEGIGDGTVAPADGSAVIGAESGRLERLVGDLLDSARMRKSAFAVRREAVDLTALAHDVARRYEGTARDAGLTLLLNTEAGRRGDRRQRPAAPGRLQSGRERDPLHAGAGDRHHHDRARHGDRRRHRPRPHQRRPAARLRALLPLQPLRHRPAGRHRPRAGDRQGAHRGDGRHGERRRAPSAWARRSRWRCRTTTRPRSSRRSSNGGPAAADASTSALAWQRLRQPLPAPATPPAPATTPRPRPQDDAS